MNLTFCEVESRYPLQDSPDLAHWRHLGRISSHFMWRLLRIRQWTGLEQMEKTNIDSHAYLHVMHPVRTRSLPVRIIM